MIDSKAIAVYVFAASCALCACGGSGGSSQEDGAVSSRALDEGQPDIAQADAPAATGVVTACAAVPTACTMPSPGYAKDIAPILNAKCNTCHANPDSGLWPLIDYEDVSDWQTLVLSDVEYCTMPPPDSTQLTPNEQATILSWVVCGAPEYGTP